MNAKFRVGDRLKIVGNPKADWADSDWNTGDYFTVAHVDSGPDYVMYWNWTDGDGGPWLAEDVKCGVWEKDVELEELADSPLYKALL